MDSTPLPPRSLAPNQERSNQRGPARPFRTEGPTSGEVGHQPRHRPDSAGRLRRLAGRLVLVVLLLGFGGCSAAQAAASSTPTLGAGTRTVVAVFTPVGANPRGSGTARLQMNAQQQTICFVIMVTGIYLPATAAHLQQGAAGTRGPIMVSLRPPNAAGIATGCTTAPSRLIEAILQHPLDYNVNVPNQPYPQGAVRGQLFLCTPDLAC